MAPSELQGSNVEGITSANNGFTASGSAAFGIQLCDPVLQLIIPLLRIPILKSHTPSFEGVFLLSPLQSRHVCSLISAQPLSSSHGSRLFYDGDRLRAEVSLLVLLLLELSSPHELVDGYSLIQRSHGLAAVQDHLSAFAAFQVLQH